MHEVDTGTVIEARVKYTAQTEKVKLSSRGIGEESLLKMEEAKAGELCLQA